MKMSQGELSGLRTRTLGRKKKTVLRLSDLRSVRYSRDWTYLTFNMGIVNLATAVNGSEILLRTYDNPGQVVIDWSTDGR